MEGRSPGKATTRHVFISYRRQDAAVVDELVSALEASHATWRDTAEIRGGQSWREAITRGIDQAYALILVVSTATEHSKEVYAEYFYALGRKLPVIPLWVEDCDLPFGLASLNARTWHRHREQTLRHLKADLDSYCAESQSVAPASDVDTYLNSLQLAYLLNVGNYTPMLGEVRQRRREVAATEPLRPVEMQSRFSLRRSSPLLDGEAVGEEVRDHQDLLPSLHALRRVVLLGEPGIGKSKTLYKFADELRSRCLTDGEAPLPVILPLREWKGETDLETFIKGQLGGLADQYRVLIDGNRLYLLCDGLNEIARDAQRAAKVEALRTQIGAQMPLVATCRELDYRDDVLRLDMDSITMHPLEPSRIEDFLTRYLIDSRGEDDGRAAAQNLFWQVAGGDDVHALWEKWRAAGASFEQFFQADQIPRESPDVYNATTWDDKELWHERVHTAANLIHLAANPYLLWMFLSVYGELGHIPGNRGGLFDEFVFHLLKREGLTRGDSPNEDGKRLSGLLEDLAWKLQSQAAAEAGEPGRGVELTLPRADAVALLGDEQSLHRAASANLLEDAESVRFTHQLLQEYFSARRLLTEIGNGLSPDAFWPPERWWETSGWEEAVVLAAGLSAEAAGSVFHWVLPANPEVAAACIRRSGMTYDDETRLTLRMHWLDVLTDPKAQPERARAAIGRALGSVLLSSGELLDNRRGVGLRTDGVPDIDWVEIRGGRVVLEDDAGEQTVKAFAIARYPVTHSQFQAFINDKDGYSNAAWWQDLEAQEPNAARWSEANAPRETVSWYEAVAFCRWLSVRLGYTVRLPTEFEWQQAATGGGAQRAYPWGKWWKKYPWGRWWKKGRCNSSESGLGRTSAVGLYPHGTWSYGPSDMAGNVWEWCLNKYNDPMADRIDSSGDSRVLRGGSWLDVSDDCRAASRYCYDPASRFSNIGFRLLRPPSPGH